MTTSTTTRAKRRRLTLAQVRKSEAAAITRSDAGEVLGVDPRTITRGIEDGTIPSIRLGRRLLIPREQFLALFDQPAASRD